MQPIKVRPQGERYEIVAGKRRWRAHELLAERSQLPSGMIEAIVENLQRADVTPMEEARAYKRLIDTGMTEAELAAKIGLRQVWRISDRLCLLNLAPEFIHFFEGGNFSSEAVYEVSRLTRHADQHRIMQMIRRGQLSGYIAIRTAVMAIIECLSQADIFEGAPVATESEMRTVSAMERKIEQVARMVQAGFDNNEVVIACKVALDQARLMADGLGLIHKHCLQMENQLRRAAAQRLLLAAE